METVSGFFFSDYIDECLKNSKDYVERQQMTLDGFKKKLS